MQVNLLTKIEKCGALQFILLFTVISEILTAFMNVLLSRIFWGNISVDLLAIGSIDALIVGLTVSSIGIYLIKKNTNLAALNQKILDEMKARKQTEESLQLARFTVDNIGDAVYWIDSRARIIDVNETACSMMGYSREELLKLTVLDIDPDFTAERWTKAWEAIKRKGRSTVETRHRTKDGRIIPVEIMANYISFGSMELDCAFARDISKRKLAEEALRASESRYKAIVENQSEFVARYLPGGVLTFINETFCQYLNLKREDLIGKSYYSYMHGEDRAAFVREIETLGINNPFMVAEARVMLPDGRVRWHKWTHNAIFDSEGHIVEYQATGRDVTASKLAEEALRQSEEKYKFLVETTHTGYVILDSSGRVIDANQEYVRMTGHEALEEILGRSVIEWTAEYDLERNAKEVRKCAETGHVRRLLIDYAGKDGRITPIEINADVMNIDDTVRIYTLCRDVSGQRLLEDERLRTQKLESVGILAGGIAHDFNNLLQGIFGYISMAKMSLDRPEKMKTILQQAEEALHLSVNLTTQLLTFSKGGKPVKKLIRLEQVIENTVKFTLSGSNTDYRTEIAADLWPVEADEGQLAQVVQNLVLNASEAMAGRGTVVVSVKNTDIPVGTAPRLREGGRFVSISIQDSGTGISEQNLAKIFDPYFTTKQKGSGLGLATSYSIIRNHGGIIEVQSEVSRGSTFTIYLPAAKDAAVAPETAAIKTVAARKGKILVMDDEELVRNVVTDMIKTLGHEVQCAADGKAAMEMFSHAKAGGSPFDLLILDLTVKGGMGGEDAIRKLRELDPGIVAVVSSGYADNPIVADYRAHGFSAFLNKPYKINALRDCINELIKPS
jgi:two-component system, cell cycle sensor histidine kinase and response regulator CckA